MPFRKEVSKIKLTVTTNCNQACSYCFVKKTGERMNFAIAKNSVDYLIGSPGKDKLLAVYGGEAFLELDLLKKITAYAKAAARKNGKKLTVSFCTNLSILPDSIIRFIKDNDIKITVSLVGPSDIHNNFRYFKNKTGSYDTVVTNLKRLTKDIPKRNISIAYVVVPSTSRMIYENFMHIFDLGIANNFNFEIIRDFETWGYEDRLHFIKGFKKIVRKILEEIKKENFIFINGVNWEISGKLRTKNLLTNCPFNYFLEVYPSGEMAFSPFLLNRRDKKKFVIGNVHDVIALKTKFKTCVFDMMSKKCMHCQHDYFKTAADHYNSYLVRKYYDSLSIKTAKIIEDKADKNKLFKAYVKYANTYLDF